MWFLFVPACIALPFGLLAFARARRFRLRERRMIVGELKDFARLLEDPLRAGEIAFTAPLRSDQDRAHDTIFTARHGHRLLSLILDTSRMRIRWWVLYELYAPDEAGGKRTRRLEATFIESAIPIESIRPLLAAARGDAPRPPAPPETKLEVRVDPFEAPASDPSAPAVQA